MPLTRRVAHDDLVDGDHAAHEVWHSALHELRRVPFV
jgi:hypothetical protein